MADEIIDPIQCPRCTFITPENLLKSVALAVFTAHVTEHAPAPATAPAPAPAPRGPKLERPKVEMGISMEDWNVFDRRWNAYVTGSGLDPANCSSQLLDCAGEELGNAILKSRPHILDEPTAELLKTMKDLAVIAVAPSVVRAELMQMHQDREENFRAFAAKVRGKAETCGYVNHDCTQNCDFTQSMVKDVLVAGIYDLDIRREILSTDGILQKSTNDIVALIEAKETARNALPPLSAALSTFRKQQRGLKNQNREPQPPPPPTSQTALCPACGTTYALFTEGSAGWNTKPHQQCIDCFRKSRKPRNRRRNGDNSSNTNNNGSSDSTNPEVGGIFAQITAVAVPPDTNVDVQSAPSDNLSEVAIN